MFELNQIFVGEYSTEAVAWCNEHNYRIMQIENDKDGKMQFQIQELPKPSAAEIQEQKLAEQTSLEARLAALEDALAEMMEGM